jgi:hypothetical protein
MISMEIKITRKLRQILKTKMQIVRRKTSRRIFKGSLILTSNDTDHGNKMN